MSWKWMISRWERPSSIKSVIRPYNQFQLFSHTVSTPGFKRILSSALSLSISSDL